MLRFWKTGKQWKSFCRLGIDRTGPKISEGEWYCATGLFQIEWTIMPDASLQLACRFKSLSPSGIQNLGSTCLLFQQEVSWHRLKELTSSSLHTSLPPASACRVPSQQANGLCNWNHQPVSAISVLSLSILFPAEPFSKLGKSKRWKQLMKQSHSLALDSPGGLRPQLKEKFSLDEKQKENRTRSSMGR